MSEREYLMEHLWERVLRAFAQGDTETAEKYVQFHDSLHGMTDAQYTGIYDAVLV